MLWVRAGIEPGFSLWAHAPNLIVDFTLMDETIEDASASCNALVEQLLKRASRHRVRNDRPFVTLSYAQSVDGCIALDTGKRLTLSCRQSLILTHKLRAAHDAILIGIGTVFSDDPNLTTRLVRGRNPQPIVVDSNLRIPVDARLVRNHCLPVIVAAREHADYGRQKALEAIGARVLRLPDNEQGFVDLSALVQQLGQLGIRTVMVEGGARIITSFYSEKLVDQVILTVAPIVIGGLHAVHRMNPSGSVRSLRLCGLRHEKIEEDIVLWGEPVWD